MSPGLDHNKRISSLVTLDLGDCVGAIMVAGKKGEDEASMIANTKILSFVSVCDCSYHEPPRWCDVVDKSRIYETDLFILMCG